MLPEFEAISFRRIIEKGAHTKPWLIEVNTDHGPTPYIVKIYTIAQNAARNSITAEVIGNVLARGFELKVPDAAIIHFPEDFRMFLNSECQVVLDLADERPKFGSEYLSPVNEFTTEISKATFERHIDLDTLYAFDNYIRNSDRGERKPNLLLHNKKAWLIDHEMAFDISEQTIDQFNNKIWEDKFGRYHLSFRYLTKARKITKDHYFETFLEYLRLLNIGILNTYFDQLEAFGYDTKRKLILDYLEHVKQNSSNFVTILRHFIR
ncbi:MAG: HipA family kinase [Bacteroidota bacterium]